MEQPRSPKALPVCGHGQVNSLSPSLSICKMKGSDLEIYKGVFNLRLLRESRRGERQWELPWVTLDLWHTEIEKQHVHNSLDDETTTRQVLQICEPVTLSPGQNYQPAASGLDSDHLWTRECLLNHTCSFKNNPPEHSCGWRGGRLKVPPWVICKLQARGSI